MYLLFVSVLQCTWIAVSAYNLHTNPIIGPSDHREAYFNGSSYIRMLTTISLKRQTGLSFRTCIGNYIQFIY